MPRKKIAAPVPCEPCKGEGTVEVTVRIGRRMIPGQTAICTDCLGSGLAPLVDSRPYGRPHP